MIAADVLRPWTAYCPEELIPDAVAFLEQARLTLADFLVDAPSDIEAAVGAVTALSAIQKLSWEDHTREAIIEGVSSIVNASSKQDVKSGFYGTASSAWCLLATAPDLRRRWPADLLSRMDKDAAASALSNGTPIELLHGSVGLATYAQMRGAEAPMVRGVIETVAAKGMDYCASLPSGANLQGPAVDLGLAHGIPGLLAFLTSCRDTRGAELVPAAHWLLRQKRSGRGPALYPFRTDDQRSARLGWCYGDLCVALCVDKVGRRALHGALLDEAKQICLKTIGRSVQDAGVADAAFCHGSSGLAHLYARLSQRMGDPRIGAEAVRWIRHFFGSLDDPAYAAFDGLGILEGVSGACLVVASALSPKEPSWDSIFLIGPTIFEHCKDTR